MVPPCDDMLSKSALQGMLSFMAVAWHRGFFLAISCASCAIPPASQHLSESNLAQFSAHIRELQDNASAFLGF